MIKNNKMPENASFAFKLADFLFTFLYFILKKLFSRIIDMIHVLIVSAGVLCLHYPASPPPPQPLHRLPSLCADSATTAASAAPAN